MKLFSRADVLPCPFCGSVALQDYSGNVCKIGCFHPDCGVKPKASSTCESTAERKWNKRPSVQSVSSVAKTSEDK